MTGRKFDECICRAWRSFIHSGQIISVSIFGLIGLLREFILTGPVKPSPKCLFHQSSVNGLFQVYKRHLNDRECPPISSSFTMNAPRKMKRSQLRKMLQRVEKKRPGSLKVIIEATIWWPYRVVGRVFRVPDYSCHY